jgi:multidrug efflux pump subunit AcrA (membrane-fusion protein)
VQVGFELKNSGMSQIPAAALEFGPGGPKVAVVDQDGTIRFRAVTIGRDDGDRVELRDGVSEGERLVLNISSQLSDGDRVRVSEDTAADSNLAMQAH